MNFQIFVDDVLKNKIEKIKTVKIIRSINFIIDTIKQNINTLIEILNEEESK